MATATSPDAPVAALHDAERAIYGVQFHPEVVHTERGRDLLERFLYDVCHCPPSWTHTSIIESQVQAVRAQVGASPVLCALSGGVDSAVAAALVHKAIGDQLTCVYVDTGLMRANESEQVEETFRRQFHIDLVHVKAADRFFEALAGVTDPEAKRKIIGELFIRIFEEVARDLVIEEFDPDAADRRRRRTRPIRATSRSRLPGPGHPLPRRHRVGIGLARPPSSPITTWAGSPTTWPSTWSSPSACCSRTRSGRWARSWACPTRSCGASPSPGPGLAVRIVGEVTPERADILRAADAIVVEEIRRAGLYRDLWQSFAVLPAVRTVGVMGDGRTYAYPIVIRAVTSDDAMTADWARLPYDLLERLSSRIINEVEGVNRVALDITSKPPGTIEWE